jgi:hypothetical protein
VRSERSRKSALRPRLAVAGGLAALVAAVAVASWQQQSPEPVTRVARPSKHAPDQTPSNDSAARNPDLPLRGVPLRAPTNLRLLVADAPAPFVLDVDRRTVTPIAALPTDGERGVGVASLGQDALVSSFRLCARCGPEVAVFLVRRGSAAATRLGRMMEAVSSKDGESIWTLDRRGAGRCGIQEVDLDGRTQRLGAHVRCRTDLIAELPAGLLVSSVRPNGRDAHSALLEPNGRVARVGGPAIQPVVRNLVMSGAGRRTPLVLRDVQTGAKYRLSWPSRRDYSLAEVTGDPTGRLAIVRFAKFSPEHRLDVWLLDTQTRRWEHLTGMPASLVPKITDVEWSADGRVVILSGDVLGVWHPGSPRLSVARVTPPKQPGIDFIVWQSA